MNGTTLNANDLVLKSGVTYTFSMMLEDEEICLSTIVSISSETSNTELNNGRDDMKIGSVSRSRAADKSREEVVSLGCATNDSLVLSASDLALCGSQIYINVLGDEILRLATENIPDDSVSSSSESSSPSSSSSSSFLTRSVVSITSLLGANIILLFVV